MYVLNLKCSSKNYQNDNKCLKKFGNVELNKSGLVPLIRNRIRSYYPLREEVDHSCICVYNHKTRSIQRTQTPPRL